jgi:lauroyl/myristoyl acyltransferase
VFWRSLADRIDHARVDERGHLFQVTGLEHLYHAQRVGRGTLLVTYHSPAAYLGQALLSRYTGLGGVLTISEVYADQLAGRELPSEDPRFTRRQSAWSATQALEGQRILRRGGVVKVVNDVAAHGLGPSVRKSLGGRLFHLKPGFAEMALLADASVVPMYNTFDAAGRIQLTFLPAFRSPAHTVAHADRVNQLLDQYVAFLEYAWGHAPESLGWGALRRYASCPPLREG